MIKDKNKEELIEFAYNLMADNKLLIEELDRLNNRSALKQAFNTIYRYTLYPLICAYNNILYKHNTTTMSKKKLTKEELVDTFNAITRYENKDYNHLAYKDLFTLTTGVKICGSCGVGIDRIHNDMQRNVFNQIKSTYPDLMPKIVLYSGKYGSTDFYMNTIPHNTYLANEVLLAKMKHERKQFASKGYIEQTSLLEGDIKILSEYIENRKNIPLTLDVQTVESVDMLIEKAEVAIEQVSEDVEVVAETPDFDVADAYIMKSEGMSNSEIGEHYGITYQRVSKELKQYDAL